MPQLNGALARGRRVNEQLIQFGLLGLLALSPYLLVREGIDQAYKLQPTLGLVVAMAMAVVASAVVLAVAKGRQPVYQSRWWVIALLFVALLSTSPSAFASLGFVLHSFSWLT